MKQFRAKSYSANQNDWHGLEKIGNNLDILIIDEFGGKKCLITAQQLNCMCDGNAYFNIKYDRFELTPDNKWHIIVLSNFKLEHGFLARGGYTDDNEWESIQNRFVEIDLYREKYGALANQYYNPYQLAGDEIRTWGPEP